MYGYERPDGSIVWGRVHCDGYPEGVGRTLLDHYPTAAKVDDLARLGYLSALGTSPAREDGTEAHARDWGRSDAEDGCFREFKIPHHDRASFVEYLTRSDCVYAYLLTTDGEWIGWDTDYDAGQKIARGPWPLEDRAREAASG